MIDENDDRLGAVLKACRPARRVFLKQCGICGFEAEWGLKGRGLARDHDHKTGAFRGYLCLSCNVGLGHFKDDPELLKKAIAYLDASHDED
jgi:hypothetical protein